MEERLPDISIKVDVSPEEFINRIMRLASENKYLLVELVNDHLVSFDIVILNIEFIGTTPHNGLLGQIISDKESPKRVSIEMRSRKWNPDPPTYELYVEAANKLFDNLLKEYNRQYNSKLRIKIQSKAHIEPQLPPKAQHLFSRFVTLANKDCLHPLDWQRFYNFISHCVSRKVKIIEDDVYRLLISSGFTEQKARYIADIFNHGIRLLKGRS